MKKQEPYTPDWASIPYGLNCVAVDPDGLLVAYSIKPSVVIGDDVRSQWYAYGAKMHYLGRISPIKDDSWRTMLYERPKNETHSPADAVSAA